MEEPFEKYVAASAAALKCSARVMAAEHALMEDKALTKTAACTASINTA